MKRKPKTLRTEATSHLDPLPFRRGEEKPAPPVRGSATQDDPAHTFLSPIGGEDQGEGGIRPFCPSPEAKPRRKSLLKFIGPNNQSSGA